jgi:hypothetical protein
MGCVLVLEYGWGEDGCDMEESMPIGGWRLVVLAVEGGNEVGGRLGRSRWLWGMMGRIITIAMI